MLAARTLAQKTKESSKLENQERNIKRVIKGAKIASTIVGALTPIGNAVSALVSIDISDFSEIKAEIQDKKVLLVFDDFERSKLSHVDLLGCINEFVENYGIKTIIIANEEKIDSPTSIQYQTEDSNERKTENKENFIGAIKEQHFYSELKEKVVSRTIMLIPDYKVIVEQIVEEQECESPEYKKFLVRRKKLIEQIFIESGTDNIRSLKCALQDFERVYKKVLELKIADNVAERFFSVYLCLLFEYKQGEIKKYNNNENIFKLANFEKKYTSFQRRYWLPSVANWVIEGIWDDQEIISEMHAFVKESHGVTPGETLLFKPVLALTDQQLQAGFEEVLQEGYSGNLLLKDYWGLVLKIASSKECHLEIPAIVDYEKLLSGLELHITRIINGEIEEESFDVRFYFDSVKDLTDEQKQIYERLLHYEDEKHSRKYKYRFLEACKDGNLEEIINLFSEMDSSFDEEMAQGVFDYYVSITDQSTRFELTSTFIRKYNKIILPEKLYYIKSRNGMNLLKDSLNGLKRKSKVEKALDGIFIQAIEKIINNLSFHIRVLDADALTNKTEMSVENSDPF